MHSQLHHYLTSSSIHFSSSISSLPTESLFQVLIIPSLSSASVPSIMAAIRESTHVRSSSELAGNPMSRGGSGLLVGVISWCATVVDSRFAGVVVVAMRGEGFSFLIFEGVETFNFDTWFDT